MPRAYTRCRQCRGLHFIGMHLMRVSHRRLSYERASLVDLSRGPFSWASLVGMHLYPPQSLCPLLRACVLYLRPRACALCLHPRACVSYLRSKASVSCPCPCSYPRASALEVHTVYPGPLRCFSRAQPAEASQGVEMCRQLLISYQSYLDSTLG